MKKFITTAALTFVAAIAYSQQPGYKASLDSLKIINDPLQQEAILNRLKSAHPKDNFEMYNFTLASNFANAKNTKKALTYFRQIDARSRTMALGTIPGQLMEYDIKTAEALLNEEMAKADNSPQDRQMLLNMYSQLMAKKGDYAKAFTAMKEYYADAQRKSPALTARYYYLMSKTGAYQEALPELEKAVTAGLGDDDFKNEVKTAYSKVNPGKDAKAYLAGLVQQAEEQRKQELVAKMLKTPAPDFKVTDQNGKVVTLADFKGQTVVIDFWATWCGPCKRALPAMQMTVNKYKNDPKVKFLFIHTWESVDDPKTDAIKYLADNNFNLPLYMDVRDPETKKNPAVSLFDVKGIPAKFVIDGTGNIRFSTSGFGGTNEAAVNELSTMIELSRQSS
ncbi:redoxin domain-containing protein [Pedobacter sp. AW31-3R]|uniref:redoxin domain-containing protein n=1 Tax=Pedobacter sp. AW31-3R TaxID=3445781 RepID=UPI003F9EF84B